MKFSDVSPLAAMIKGEGAMGDMMASGFGGMIPSSIASAAKKKREAAEEAAAAEVAAAKAEAAKRQAGVQMKKGGTVRSASSRADGIAAKGKTRGKIC
jgi:hypothetical protein